MTPEQATSLVARLRDFFPLGDVPVETGGAYASMFVELDLEDAAAACRRVVETCRATWPTMAEILDAYKVVRGARLSRLREEREREAERLADEEAARVPIEERRENLRRIRELIATGGIKRLEEGE